MRKIKGFSYDPEKEKDIVEYINSKANGSQYIWSLVRKDMSNQEDHIENLVKRYIDKHLKGVDRTEDKNVIDVKDVNDILSIK